MSEVIERELGWDDEIEKDGPEFVLLPEGDYSFEVVGFERARHNGSEKLPACNKAQQQLNITYFYIVRQKECYVPFLLP